MSRSQAAFWVEFLHRAANPPTGRRGPMPVYTCAYGHVHTEMPSIHKDRFPPDFLALMGLAVKVGITAYWAKLESPPAFLTLLGE